MTHEAFRTLLYPLGFAASFLFGLRVLMQWIGSEKNNKSLVTPSFWIISLTANLIMTVHSFIQLQYPICLIQGLNGWIAWRNLELMKGSKSTWKLSAFKMGCTVFVITSLFIFQGWWLHTSAWMHPPSLWSDTHSEHIFWLWHGLGITGMALFASRFWVQWWQAETHQASFLSQSFWWVSLSGSLISIAYFYRLHDLVNLLSYSTGLLPYLRNLVLIKRSSVTHTLQKKNIFIFAGEQSGDVIGGGLLEVLKKKHPDLHMYGVGGEQMRGSGLECILPMEKFQVMGFTDVIKAAPKLFKHFHFLQKRILKDQPQAIVLIDYPDFNMLLEKSLRRKGYQGKLIHYVCPTVWAWRRSRVKALTQTLDLLLSIFPFEKDYFSESSLPVSFVGHPLVSTIENYHYSKEWKSICNIPDEPPILALFPGSRVHEIEANLPIQLEAAHRFCKSHPETIVAISQARPELASLILSIVQKSPLASLCHMVPAALRYELMRDATFALATSGTVTLELALHCTPTVVTYQLSPFNYFVGKYLFRIRLPHLCIVNIILNKTVFPECYARNLSSDWVFREAEHLFKNTSNCKRACEELKNKLERHDASQKAAEEISKMLLV